MRIHTEDSLKAWSVFLSAPEVKPHIPGDTLAG
jgi:hypothetical protein